MSHYKLVRDLIPEIIQGRGEIAMLELEEVRFKKRRERGGFDKGVLLKC